ncbi:hypothetical protein ACFLRI_03175 [Bacteroidota bacterium]
MKKILFILVLLSQTQVYGQSGLKFSLSGGTFNDPNLSGLYGFDSIYVAVDQQYPFKTGMSIMYEFNPNWSVSSGYHYNYRYLKISVFSESVGEFFSGTRLHTSEIPILLKYNHTFNDLNNLKLYCQIGMSFDYMFVPIKSFWKERVIDMIFIKETWRSFYVLNLPLKLIPASVVEFGISNNLGKAGSIECGFQWHRQFAENIGNEIIYFNQRGSGKPTSESFQYFIRSSYSAFSINYIFPWSLFSINKKKKN